jgi:O-antigen ligase
MIFFYVLVGIMPLTQHPLWGRFVGELTVFKYIGAACVLYAGIRLVTHRSIPLYFGTWQARLLVVLYLIATASYFTSALPGALEYSPFLSYTSFLLLFFVTVTVVDSLRRLHLVMLVAVGSVAFASLYVIREWQKYHSLYASYRPGWVVGDPNYFTISALLTLPIAFYFVIDTRAAWERLFCSGCLVLTLVAVTLCASRGGFLGLIAAFIFAVWHSRERLLNLVLVGALIVPMILFAPLSPLERLLHPTYGDRAAEDSRTAAWQAGLSMVRAHPITGVGLGNFKPLVPQYSQMEIPPNSIAHNAYVEIAAEMGVPALLVFLGILCFSFRTLSRIHTRAFHSHIPLLWRTALGLQAGLVGSSVAIFFVSGQYQKLLWLTIFLSICIPRITPKNSRLQLEHRT